MLILELDDYFEEGSREVKTASGNTKTGLSKQVKIPRDHQPCDSNGSDKAAKKGGKY